MNSAKSWISRRQGLLMVFLICLLAVLSTAACGRRPGNMADAGLGVSPVSPAPVAVDRARDYKKPNIRRPENAPGELTAAEKKFGIEILSLHPTSGGYMLDLRYRVLVPDKAKPLLDKKTPVSLFHPETGVRLGVPSAPKTGALRQKTDAPEAGKVYFMIFANPGQVLHPGDKVNLIIGDDTAEGLDIQ